MPEPLLVTGTDTDVGKTWVSSLILRSLTRHGHRIRPYKPVCSGGEESANGLIWNDVEQLTEACVDRADTQTKRRVCPQTFTAAVAPNVAATLEGRTVDDALLRSGAKTWNDECDLLLIEGAGGILCPLSDQTRVIDLAADLQSPVLIVAANRLGVINHTLLTIQAAQNAQLPIAAVILNDVSPGPEDSSRSSNFSQLQLWLPDTRLLTCGYQGTDLNDQSGNPFPVRDLWPQS